MKKIYGEINMSWLKVILFAVVAGVYTGAIMLVPALENTSFQDIGISFEWWVIFAVIVVVNCKKNWEAMLKCFVFFLISQPLVYIVEMIFGSLSLDLALNYYSIWFRATLLTIPGGFIAYYCKKQNLFGAVILALGNSIQAAHAVIYLSKAFHDFPHHLLSGIVCILSIFVMSFCIQKEKKNRMVAILLPVVLFLLLLLFLKLSGRVLY